MPLDLSRFFKACNPAKTLDMSVPEDQKYYIDFAPVRGGKIIEELKRTIARISPDDPTCQLFTGHIGCGKSTELLRLKSELEAENFHVVYFESSQDLDMADVDVSDILLAITHQVSENLEKSDVKLKPGYFTNLFTEVADFLQTPIEFGGEAELSVGIAKLTAKTQDNPKLRNQLRQYLEPRAESILKAINEEVLKKARQQLIDKKGKRGLVVIVDNLDRVDNRAMPSGRTQPEYLFVDRGAQLRRLDCHVVYTIPLALLFSDEYESLKNRLGGGVAPKVLPMIPVTDRLGNGFDQGMELLRQAILARAFPDVPAAERSQITAEVFDAPETLDRLCQVSGGHPRTLLGLLYRCLQQEDPPFNRTSLEHAVKDYRDDLILSIDDNEWELLLQVAQGQGMKGEDSYQALLRSMLIYEYRDGDGRWFGLNPALQETERFRQWQASQLGSGGAL
ncbi:MAG: P-loop NTPase fold protein [Cyanophyceae cyanobacterium]